MMAADQFCLRWNNFQINITSALESLKCDEDLVDVTLTCDGQNVKAHKVILSACSPYFRNVFKENPCQHPVVILKDVSYEDVTALLNFMYQGEVYITQDRLAPFLHTAELLQVRGLAGATNPFKESQLPVQQQQPKHQQQPKPKKQVHTPSGQLRRTTPPPLSTSPSTLPHQPAGKSSPFSPFRSLKNPLVSPIPKDSHPISNPAFHLKEKPAGSHPFTLGRESDAGHSKPQHNLPNASTSSGNYQLPSGGEQSSGSPYPPDPQLYQSSIASPSSYEPGVAGSLYQGQDEQSSSQPSSPQPKRRKAFPRRLSSNPVLSEDVTGGESQPCEVVHVVPGVVKQEPVDELLEGKDGHDDDNESLRSDDVDASRTGYYSQPDGDSQDPVSMDRDVVKEEEGTSDVSPHSVLLRSLSGVSSHNIQQSDAVDFPSQAVSSTDVFLMPPWSAGSGESFPSSASWTGVKRRIRSSVEKSGDVDGTLASRIASRTLYQKRKHIWRSRRPVQCPNCQKVITMAYNLKSHLSTCLKRNGGLYRRT